MRHLLRRLDFVYKKPKAIPGKADQVAQEEFLRLIEAKLAENRRETAVYYADGTHPQHNTHCAHGWIKRGHNKEIKTNSGRQRVNINGVVNAHDPTDVVIEESSSINAQSTIALLKKQEQKNFTRSAHKGLLSSTAQLGYAKIALAQQFSFIFFKNE